MRQNLKAHSRIPTPDIAGYADLPAFSNCLAGIQLG
jgi:hypothetical protein